MKWANLEDITKYHEKKKLFKREKRNFVRDYEFTVNIRPLLTKSSL